MGDQPIWWEIRRNKKSRTRKINDKEENWRLENKKIRKNTMRI